MIERIATVPGTALLIPDIGAGAAGDLADVRRAALGRVAWAAGDTGEVAVLAQDPVGDEVRRIALGDSVGLHPLGLATTVPVRRMPAGRSEVSSGDPSDDASSLPVSVLVAAWLAAEAGVGITGVWAVPADPSTVDVPDEVAQSTGLVVIADGSSTRTPKAPGALVDGAVDFDEALTASVASVDVAFFDDPQRAVDADAFGVQGLGAWAAAARLAAGLAGEWTGEVDLTSDPFGVHYVVAGWSPSP